MNPIQAFSQLLRVDPNTGRILLAGLGVIAAAAIVTAWGVDVYTAGLAGLYVVFLGVVILVIRLAIEDLWLKAILSWFLVCFFILIALTFFASVVLQAKNWLPPPRCLIHFWDDCQPREPMAPVKSATRVKPTEEAPAQEQSVRPLGTVTVSPKPLPVIETRSFSNQSGSINFGCEEVAQASVSFNVPAGFVIVSADARWIDLSNAKDSSSVISARSDISVSATGTVRGLDRNFFNCSGGGHGTLEIFGTIRGRSE